jgi:diketogulonate reductase-like aldo/keto reductase
MPMRVPLTRRAFVAAAAAAGAAASAGLVPARAAAGPVRTRAIPRTGERLPVIGMGTWITFNVGRVPRLRDARSEVLKAFFELDGGVIDSSPMYGSSEAVVGYGLKRIEDKRTLFAATKVWTASGSRGPDQIEESRRLWGVPRFDLLQVHNLLAWEDHLRTLLAMKAAGKVRHVGVTTSHGDRHALMERVMRTQPIDFVQFTYNVRDREAEARLLPLAAERGLAVIVNRPFRQGALIDRMKRHRLPAWAAEFDAANWAQFLLKFIVSHPAVTCAIPATTRVDHMHENMGALHGRLPDPAMRRRMVRYVERL